MSALECDTVFHVWFALPLSSERGRHWLTELESPHTFCSPEVVDVHAQVVDIEALLSQQKYDLVLSCLPLVLRASWRILSVVQRKHIPLVLWAEQLLPRNRGLTRLKLLFYRHAIAQLQPLAIFAIGDRAVEQYRHLADCLIYLMPYYECLEAARAQGDARERRDRPFTFLFSGQLVRRNNIAAILEACENVLPKALCSSRMLFYGDGPLAHLVERASQQNGQIELDRSTPERWSHRVNVLARADVLLSTGLHSGWGLTVPEALASGMPVIATSGIESARYYIRDGVNGFLCSPEPKDISQRMKLFLRSPGLLDEMRSTCRVTSMVGDVSFGVHTLARTCRSLLSST